jgi:hypothetical protein
VPLHAQRSARIVHPLRAGGSWRSWACNPRAGLPFCCSNYCAQRTIVYFPLASRDPWCYYADGA